MSTVSQHLQHIEASGLIRLAAIEPDLEYLFRHALVQDAAYESLLRQDRKRLHLSVAETLDSLYPDHPDDLAPMLASHFYLAGDSRALKYYLQAGDAAYSMYANREAVMHYTHALEVAGWPVSAVTSEQLIHLCLQCGRAHQFASQLDEAIAFYQQITDLARAQGDQSLELTAQVEYVTILCTFNSKSDFAKGKAIAHDMLALARQLGDRKTEAKILWALLLPTRFEGEPLAGISYGEQALSIASELGLRELMAYILNDMNMTYGSAGHIEKAMASVAEARKLWRELGNLPMLADSLSGSVPHYYLVGKFDEALAFADEAYQISLSIDNLWGQAYSGLFSPKIYLDRGEFDVLFEVAKRSLKTGEKASFIAPAIYTRQMLAMTYCCLGAFEEGLAVIQQADELTRQLKLPWQSVGAAAFAQLYILVGDLDQAQYYVNEGYRFIAESYPDEFSPAVCWIPFAEAEICIAQREYTRAVSILDTLEETRNVVARLGESPLIPEGFYFRAKALIGLEQFEMARGILQKAHDRALTLNFRRLLWQILYTLSEVETKLGNLSEAARCRQQSREVLIIMANHIGRTDLRKSFEGLPAVQVVLNS